MEILYWPLSFIISYIMVYTIATYVFMLQYRHKRISTILLVVTLAIVSLVSFLAPRQPAFYNFMLVVPVIVIIISLSLGTHRKRSVLVIISSYLILSILGYLVASVVYSISALYFIDLIDNPHVNLLVDSITALFTLVVGMLAQIIRRLFRCKTKPQISVSAFNVFSLLCFHIGMAPVTVAIQQQAGTSKYSTALISTTIFSFAFLSGTFLTQIMVNRSVMLRGQLEAFRQYEKGQSSYYEALLNWNKELRRIQHDNWAHYLCLQEFLAQGQIQKAAVYLETLTQGGQPKSEAIKSGNLVCDIVLNHLTAQYNVLFVTKGVLTANLNIADIDLCILLSNLLHNAAQAVQATDEPEVYVYFGLAGTHLSITVKNKSKEKIRIKNGLPASSKGYQHGFGLQNAQEVARQYNGSLECHQADGYFIAEVTLADCARSVA